MKKILLSVLLSAVLLSGCGGNTMTSLYDDDEKIASESDTYSFDETMQEIDQQNFGAEIERMEGTSTIWSYKAESDEDIEIHAFLKVDAGKAKLVLIDPDNTVSIITKGNRGDVASNDGTLAVKKGENRIKLVGGKNTKLVVNLSISKGTFNELY